LVCRPLGPGGYGVVPTHSGRSGSRLERSLWISKLPLAGPCGLPLKGAF
jgi:hypothetical protein